MFIISKGYLGFSFDRGVICLAYRSEEAELMIGMSLCLPWMYLSRYESDHFGGTDQVWKLDAPTQISIVKSNDMDFWSCRFRLLGFGIGFSRQKGF